MDQQPSVENLWSKQFRRVAEAERRDEERIQQVLCYPIVATAVTPIRKGGRHGIIPCHLRPHLS